ncbi:MAG: hypothetical protein EXR39_04090 [Betaproteobacteria bacterium]|nr:hypothetical protein [Betaproteobacteria bacterium]
MSKKQSTSSDRMRVQAMQLLGRWTRLSAGHIALGAGCLCGASFGALQPSDYDEQIVAFLVGRHPRIKAIDHARLDQLLRAIANGAVARDASLTPPECQALLGDVERSLDSFDEVHRTGSKGI